MTFHLSKDAIAEIRENLEYTIPEAYTADGLDDAIIGIAYRCSQPSLVTYSVNKILDILVERDGMTYDEAREFYEFNIVGAWVGEYTPIFLEIPEDYSIPTSWWQRWIQPILSIFL